MVTATFRFYEELNDFLPPARRRQEFISACAEAATTKHMIEALGVPHTEVELVLVNGESVGFDRLIAEGDRIAVYPKFESLDITSLLRVRPSPLRVVRFIADAHLGGLARLLRMCGFDTLFSNSLHDAAIAAIAEEEGRIVLTRDRELLKRRNVSHGCFVHAIEPERQLRDLFARLDLAGMAKPLALCLECNAPLRALAKAEAEGRVPDGVFERQPAFSTCDVCRRVFWEGSHWRRMRELVADVVGGPREDHPSASGPAAANAAGSGPAGSTPPECDSPENSPPAGG